MSNGKKSELVFSMAQEAAQIEKIKLTSFMGGFVLSVRIASYVERQLY